jgi:lysophospholipase L1-like esterase
LTGTADKSKLVTRAYGGNTVLQRVAGVIAVGCALVAAACGLVLGTGEVPALAVTSAASSPGSATPAVFANPSTGLDDGQHIQVSGAGFDPGVQVGIAECEAGATSEADCYLQDVVFATTDQSGSFTTSFEVARVIQVGSAPIGATGGSLIDCAQADACALGAIELSDSSEAAIVPIGFDPSVPAPTPLQVTIQLAGGTIQIAPDGSITLSGTVSCNESATVNIQVNISQPQNATQGGAVVPDLSCDASPSPYTAVISPTGGLPFESGPADVQVTVWGQSASPSATGQATASATQALTLEGLPVSSSVRYYLALGDSLATGFAAGPGQGYTDDLLAHFQSQVPGLQLVDLGVSGETTTSFIDGGQLQAAEAFLAAHSGQVSFVTIDIGGNDIVGCGSVTLPAPSSTVCVNSALTTIAANLRTILSGLRQAGGTDLKIYGMNYFDPFLIDWLLGPAGQAPAQTSVSNLLELNSELTSLYTGYGIPTADVAAAFHSTDFTDMVDSPWGSVPENVFLACSWLDVSCEAGGPEGLGDDANAAGYQAIAAAFEQVIGLGFPPSTTQPTTPTPPVVTTTAQTSPSGPATRSGSLPNTGFPVQEVALFGFLLVLLGLVAIGLSADRRHGQGLGPRSR